MADGGTEKREAGKKRSRGTASVTRKRAPKKETTMYARTSTRKQTTRKAPTRTHASSGRARSSTAFKVAALGIAFLAVSAGASVYVGLAGEGQINVASTINKAHNAQTERQNNADGDQTGSDAVYNSASNNPPTVPNGGLRPAKVQIPPRTESAPSQGVTTEATATTSTTDSATTTEVSTEDDQDNSDEVPVETSDESIEESTTE